MIFPQGLFRKKSMLLEYSDIGEPYLRIETSAGKSMELSLGAHRVENGKLLNVESLAESILFELGKAENFRLSLKLKETFKSVISVPKMNAWQAQALAARELKRSFPKWRERYLVVQSRYKCSFGYIFTAYFIPNRAVEPFRALAGRLNVRMLGADIFGNELFKKIYPDLKRDFACIYTKGNVATIIAAADGKLVTAYDFAFVTKEDIVKRFSLVMGKHEFELEKKPVKNLVVIGDRSLKFDGCFRGVNCIRWPKTAQAQGTDGGALPDSADIAAAADGNEK